MNKPQTHLNGDIDSRMKEAEVYYSMGLLDESLGAYRELLAIVAEDDVARLDIIKERINSLTSEITVLEKDESEKLTTEDLSIIKKTFTGDENVPAVLDSAKAYKELGLYREAIAEYEKLFDLEYEPDKIIPLITDCLFETHTHNKIIRHVDRLLESQQLKNKIRAQIKFDLGLEMEKRGDEDSALELFQTASRLDPRLKELKTKLDSLMSRLSYDSRYDYLLSKNMVTTDQLQRALALSKKAGKSVEFILIENFKIKKEEIVKSLSYFYGCPSKMYVSDLPVPVELISGLKKTFLQQAVWVPLAWEKGNVEILTDDPRDLVKTDNIRALLKTSKLNFNVGIKEDIDAFIRDFFDGGKKQDMTESSDFSIDDFDMIPDISFEEEEDDLDDREEEYDEASGQVVKLVDQVLVAAYRKTCSDIHIEPSPITKATSIRFRLDGVCQEYIQVPNSMARGILSRIKIMSGLDIAERRLPQDGKIKFKRKGIPPFELRVATMPTAGGFEDAVLRILARSGAMKITTMGIAESNLNTLMDIVSRPYGLVLVVGPTGSGKTTTLHAALGHINKPGVKIWTAEDPIEITQQGLRQVEVKPKIGLDFARVMRSFLRADPDIIMIGEMRDHETASIGVEASLTGHLVFSTLHTNSAPETVTRLLDMGLNPLNFSDAFLGVLAQRLVRRLCPQCKEEYNPTQEEFDEIIADYGEEYFKKDTGIEYNKDFTLYGPVGCDVCSGTGYKGRLGIHELMEGTKPIKNMIKKQATTENLFNQALKDGLRTLNQDGISKVIE